MGTKLEYTVIDAPSTNELVANVESMMEIGFEPIGGVAVEGHIWQNERKGYEEYSVVFYQAMVKRPV